MSATRKLAAIMAVDVVGYSRLMGEDEAGTARAVREHREAGLPIIGSLGGRVVKTMGDGLLLEFPSVVAAVECAMAIQKLMVERNADTPENKRILYRIGVNLGDVLIEGEDILGDGVNIAARLEAMAEPGGILVSGSAFDHVRGKVDAHFVDLGDKELKNIARPVRVYRLALDRNAANSEPTAPTRLALPDKPSIAVLPFQNMSEDAEQGHFADGVVEDIITALSQFHSLFVIARNSSFTYKGKAVDVRQVGRELGVRYVLEGSVRKGGSRVRITSQLVDAATGGHLWADRFDGLLEDIFDLQDQVTTRVIGQIAPKVEQAEIERAKRKPTESLNAYDYFLRGMTSFYGLTRDASDEALQQYYKAIELDRDFAAAHGWAAITYTKRKQSNWMADPEREIVEGVRLARRAAELGHDDALALSAAGFTLAFLAGELDVGMALIDRALALNPNFAPAWQGSGWVRAYIGEPNTAIEHLAHAMRLSPLDPQMVQLWLATSLAMRFAGRCDEAASWARKILQEQPNFLPALLGYAASSALAGRIADAQVAMSRALQIDPSLRISSSLSITSILRRPEDRSKVVEGARLAGMPE
jgi:adenylate cyclase